PKEPAQRARLKILIDYGMNHLNGPYQTLREELAKDEKERDTVKIAEAKKQTIDLLKRFENEMAEQTFLGGNFSLLDADLIPRMLRYDSMGILPDPTLPRLSLWLRRMKERPSVKVIA
ncbi:MAG: glutathione S-transferase family protein, partial [Candidatus Binatia bacterium]